MDHAEGWSTLITSANPHDGSSLHSNVALRIDGPVAHDVIASEAEVASWSGVEVSQPPAPEAETSDGAMAQLLTEAAIRDAVLAQVDDTVAGDRLDVAAFYVAHRGVVQALKEASGRGVAVRVLLDPNREAFGFEKGGLPNQPVAEELLDAGVQVRWCVTDGEQCHSKVVLVRRGPAKDELADAVILGSANLTRRNLDDFNLESSVLLKGRGVAAIDEIGAWFDQRWDSSDGRRTSRAWAPRDEAGWFDGWRYRLMEASGLSTF